jgi:hypothetical protein
LHAFEPTSPNPPLEGLLEERANMEQRTYGRQFVAQYVRDNPELTPEARAALESAALTYVGPWSMGDGYVRGIAQEDDMITIKRRGGYDCYYLPR